MCSIYFLLIQTLILTQALQKMDIVLISEPLDNHTVQWNLMSSLMFNVLEEQDGLRTYVDHCFCLFFLASLFF